jgi:hypothetical protein
MDQPKGKDHASKKAHTSQNMSAILGSQVEFNPVAVSGWSVMSATCRSDCATFAPIEIEGDGIRFDVSFEGVLELVVRDRSGAVTIGRFPLHQVPVGQRAGGDCVHVEILEGDEVIRVRPLQQRLKHHEILPRHQTTLGGIRDTEQDGKLAPTDFRQVLGGSDGFDK